MPTVGVQTLEKSSHEMGPPPGNMTRRAAPMAAEQVHRFLQILRDGKHLSARKIADLLSWKHSGFHIDSGREKPVAPHDTDGRKRLAEPERSGDRQPARLPAG